MSETLNEWYPQPISSSSSSSFGYSSMASDHTNSSTTQIGASPSSKPIKRRSRSSKRTPTTLLNANTANFRALVQQFTGCHRSKTSTTCSNSLLIGCQKGPINLNFQLGSVSAQNNQRINYEAPFGDFSARNNYNYDDQFQTQIHQLQQQQQQGVEQNYVNVLSHEDVNNTETRSNEIGLDDLESMMMMGDGVDLMDDTASLQPLSDLNFDHGFFWNLHNQFPSLSHTDQ